MGGEQKKKGRHGVRSIASFVGSRTVTERQVPGIIRTKILGECTPTDRRPYSIERHITVDFSASSFYSRFVPYCFLRGAFSFS